MRPAAARLRVNVRQCKEIASSRRSRCRPRFFGSGTEPQAPLALVLDVDETLWRTYIPGISKTKKLPSCDFVVELDHSDKSQKLTAWEQAAWTSSRHETGENTEEKPPDARTKRIEIQVSMRPGLDEFFDWIRERRSEGVIEGPWIFTQASDKYLRAMLPEVDKTGEIFGERILTRGSCTRMRKPWPWVHKDLNQVPCGVDRGAHPERVVLVENNVMSCLHYPRNSLIVHDWIGDHSKPDTELRRVSSTLDALLLETKGAPGSYAERLAAVTPGHLDYEEALADLRERVEEELPEGKAPADAIRSVWRRALKAKYRLLKHAEKRQ